MNKRSFLLLSLTAVVFAPALEARAQTAAPSPVFTRPRVVNVSQQTPTATPTTPAPTPQATRTPAPRPPAPATTSPAAQQPPSGSPATYGTPATQTAAPRPYVPPAPLQPAHPPSLNKFRERVAEAQRLLKSRLTLTSATPNTAFVTIAAL